MFEETITPFMTEALKKKPLTDTIEQVNEEAWEKKMDDTPKALLWSRIRKLKSHPRT